MKLVKALPKPPYISKTRGVKMNRDAVHAFVYFDTLNASWAAAAPRPL